MVRVTLSGQTMTFRSAHTAARARGKVVSQSGMRLRGVLSDCVLSDAKNPKTNCPQSREISESRGKTCRCAMRFAWDNRIDSSFTVCSRYYHFLQPKEEGRSSLFIHFLSLGTSGSRELVSSLT